MTARQSERALDYAPIVRRKHEPTPFEQTLLLAIRSARRPITAYELLDLLQRSLERRIAPTTIYRSLEYLQKNNLVVKLESQGAFIARSWPEGRSNCAYFICTTCGATQEVANAKIDEAVNQDAAVLGFQPHRRVMEFEGTCARCLDGSQRP